MENTDLKNQEENVTESQEERTFTQAELNAIVQKRIAETAAKFENYEELKEKAAKYDTIEEESKTELQKVMERADALKKELDGLKKEAAVRTIRASVAEEMGVPASLLTGETEEECKTQAEGILSFAKPNAYPAVKDAGEARKPASDQTTNELFAEWMTNRTT